MEHLFTWLSHSLEGAPLIALLASFMWGVASVVLSPCHLASIPLIIGVITEDDVLSTRRAFWASLCFAAGILVTIAVMGIVAALAGRLAGDLGGYGNYLAAVVFFVVGLHLLEVISLPGWRLGGQAHGRTPGGAMILGLVVGTALGPCTFAFMAPVLALAFRTAAQAPVYASSLLLAYGLGHAGVIVAAGTATAKAERWLDWSASSRGPAVVKKLCGALLLVAGLYMIHAA